MTNETLAAGAQVAKDNGGDGLHRQRDWVRSSPRAGRRSCRRLIGGQQDAAGLLKAVQAEYEKELNR